MADLTIRVTLLDTMDELALAVPGTTRISEVKQAVLSNAGIKRAAAEYVVKYKGAELYEGAKTLAEAGVVSNGALIVLLRRRIPVR